MIKLKSEIDASLNTYMDCDFISVDAEGSSDGCSPKYTNNRIWIKVDSLGYEALAEVIVSRAVSALGFDCIEYHPCFFVIGDYAYSACSSASFMQSGLQEVTLGHELCRLTGFANLYALMQHINGMSSVKDRINFVVYSLKSCIDPDVFMRYLAGLLWIDSLVYNGDRHLHNILLFRNQDRLNLAPYFDFGDSLLSNTSFKFPMKMTVAYGVYKVKSKPFSSSFEKQVTVLQEYLPVGYPSTISIDTLDLYKYYEPAHIHRALSVLRLGLTKYGIILNTDSSIAEISEYF